MRSRFLGTVFAAGLAAFAGFGLSAAPASAQKVLKMQASWPASQTIYDNFTMFAKRVEELSGGQLKIETMPGGQIVPPFEVLDATHKKVIDGSHTWAGYWQGKNSAAILLTGGPGGPWGMDHQDFLGWMWWGGGQELVAEFYKDVLKLDVVSLPILSASPQALGWFKKRIESLADFKGMKCRQTGVAGQVFNEMGMKTVNMPGGEIMPAAERGTIDCAEWVGGIEDLRFGFHTIWKYHYAPSLHESVSIGNVLVNGDVWRGLTKAHQEIVKAAATETLIVWWVGWQKQNADAVKELREKHKVNILQTPSEIHSEFLKAWDRIAAKEAERNSFFKKEMDSQKAWAAIVVPVKRLYFPAYNISADHYWPAK